MLNQTITTDTQAIMEVLAEKLVRCLKGTVHPSINLKPSQSNLYDFLPWNTTFWRISWVDDKSL